jgi:hypothetical protein
LPARRKFPPPTDWIGHTAPYPSWPDVQAWTDGDEGAGNLALRLPPDVLGLDVDNYAGKTGADTIAQLTAQYGPLPAAPNSTSRDDGSGIRLYRVPEGHGWRDNLRAGRAGREGRMKNFPRTGSPGSDSPYERPPAEGQAIYRFSDEQRQYVDQAAAHRQAVAADPTYNGRRPA